MEVLAQIYILLEKIGFPYSEIVTEEKPGEILQIDGFEDIIISYPSKIEDSESKKAYQYSISSKGKIVRFQYIVGKMQEIENKNHELIIERTEYAFPKQKEWIFFLKQDTKDILNFLLCEKEGQLPTPKGVGL